MRVEKNGENPKVVKKIMLDFFAVRLQHKLSLYLTVRLLIIKPLISLLATSSERTTHHRAASRGPPLARHPSLTFKP